MPYGHIGSAHHSGYLAVKVGLSPVGIGLRGQHRPRLGCPPSSRCHDLCWYGSLLVMGLRVTVAIIAASADFLTPIGALAGPLVFRPPRNQ